MAQRTVEINARTVLTLLLGIAVLIMIVAPVVRGARDVDLTTDLPALLAFLTMMSTVDADKTTDKEPDQ